ncbi:MAG: tyrosine--tRNA ligase, partial [Candidatus Gastranaerophilaceae bacterium]
EVDENAQTYFEQMNKVVDIGKAEVRNNADWLHQMSLTDLLKLSSQITVAQMLVRDDFAKRYAEGKPISVHEFFYPLMQAYDSVAIDSDIELGGTDQRFNVLLGRDIQLAYGKKHPQMVMLLPLLEGTDGIVKMSKSYPENCISINEDPNNMYGKLMSIPDNLIYKYYELLTDVSKEELNQIQQLINDSSVNPRDIKMKLAKMIVTQYYDEEIACNAEQEFVNVVQQKGIPQDIPEEYVQEGKLLIDIIAELNLTESKGEAKRLLKGGGVKIDGVKIDDLNQGLSFDNKNAIVLQVGKRKFVKLKNLI